MLYVTDHSHPYSGAEWTVCAAQSAYCTCTGQVIFGVDTTWSSATEVSGKIYCHPSTFGFNPSGTLTNQQCKCKATPTFGSCTQTAPTSFGALPKSWEPLLSPWYTNFAQTCDASSLATNYDYSDTRYTFGLRNLTAVPGYNAGTDTFSYLPTYFDGGEWKFGPGITVPGGKILFVGVRDSSVGVYESSTNTWSTFAAWLTSTCDGANCYSGMILGPHETIYFVPSQSSKINVVPMSVSTTGAVTFGAATTIVTGITGDYKYSGGALAGGGITEEMIVFAPCGASAIGILLLTGQNFQTLDISTVTFGSHSNANAFKFSGAVLAPNGMVYFIPAHADVVGKFDPTVPTPFTGAFSDIDTGLGTDYPSQRKFHDGVLAPNGKIYCVPATPDVIGVIDPSTDTFSTIDVSSSIDKTTDDKFYNGILAPNGFIYFVPRNAHGMGVFNPVSESFSIMSDFHTMKAWGGMCLRAADGVTNGATLSMALCDLTDPLQQWDYDASTKAMKLGTTGKCLDASQRNTEGGLVHMWGCDDTLIAQSWDYTLSNGRFKSTDGTCLDTSAGGQTAASPVHMWGCNDSPGEYQNNQRWIVDFLKQDAKWFGGLLAPSGDIILAPAKSSLIGVYTPGNSQPSYVTSGLISSSIPQRVTFVGGQPVGAGTLNTFTNRDAARVVASSVSCNAVTTPTTAPTATPTVSSTPCGANYTEQTGQIPGDGKVNCRGGGEAVASCPVCADLCTANWPSCRSYECSPTALKCSLNYNWNATSSTVSGDYMFCHRDFGVDIHDSSLSGYIPTITEDTDLGPGDSGTTQYALADFTLNTGGPATSQRKVCYKLASETTYTEVSDFQLSGPPTDAPTSAPTATPTTAPTAAPTMIPDTVCTTGERGVSQCYSAARL